MLSKLVRSMVFLLVGLEISLAAESLPSSDSGMRSYSISCLGGKGYKVRNSPDASSNGILGAFLAESDADAVALEIQRRFIGNRGVDDEETELIGLDLSGYLDSGRSIAFSPARARFALSDSLGKVGGAWQVNLKLSRLTIRRLDDGLILLSGSLVVANSERPNEKKSVLKVSCIIPS